MEGYEVLCCLLLEEFGIEEAVRLIMGVSEVNVACFQEDCVGSWGITFAEC
jgi:hypothetical protein